MKKKTLKLTLLIVSAMLITSVFTACGTNSAGDSSDTESSGEENTDAEAADEDDADAETTDVTTIHVATGGSTKPWTYYDENDELVGYDIDLMRAVFDRLPQYEVEFDVVEFASIFTGLDSGYYEMGANNLSMTEERQEKYLFSTPKTKQSEVLLSSTIDFPADTLTLDDLTDYVYTLEPGNAHTTEVEKYNEAHPDNPIEINYTEEDVATILQNVQSGKYELFSTWNAMYYGAYQKEFGLDLNTATLDYGEGQAYSYFIAAKGQEQLLEDFNEALAETVADGTAKELSEKYIGEDYVPYEAYE